MAFVGLGFSQTPRVILYLGDSTVFVRSVPILAEHIHEDSLPFSHASSNLILRTAGRLPVPHLTVFVLTCPRSGSPISLEAGADRRTCPSPDVAIELA